MKKFAAIVFSFVALSIIVASAAVTTTAHNPTTVTNEPAHSPIVDNFNDVVEVANNITAVIETFDSIAHSPRPAEPYFFTVEYKVDDEMKKMNLSSETFGSTIELNVDEESLIYVGICSSRAGFHLSEQTCTVYEGREVFRTDYSSNMGNEWYHFRAGQSAIISLNWGTNDEPDWVTFKVSTAVC